MKKNIIYLLSLTVLLAMGACTYDVGIHTPGGAPGEPGFSAYDLWKNQLEAGNVPGWPKENNTIADYFKYKKGKDGANGTNGTNGKDGANGQSAYDQWKELVETGNVDNPHKAGEKWDKAKNSPADFFDFLTGGSGEGGQVPRIGDNGNWWIGNDDLGVPAKGEKGDPGRAAEPPVVTIENGFWVINGKPTTTKAIGANGKDGADGVIPAVKVTDDGYWEIGGVKTSTKARGTDGNVPEVSISADNTWVIGGVDTKKSVFGPKGNPGRDGENGASAYELWKDYIKDGNAPNPHKPGEKWPKENNEESHFWLYMKGYKQYLKEQDVYTIVPMFYNLSYREYANPADGTIKFEVLDKQGQPVPEGVTIKTLKGANLGNTPVKTDADGRFVLNPDQLPNELAVGERTGKAVVVLPNGTEEETAETTVPNRVNVRITMQRVFLAGKSQSHEPVLGAVATEAIVERQIDGKWEKFPGHLYVPDPQVRIIQQGHEDSFDFANLIEPSDSNKELYRKLKISASENQSVYVKITVERELESTPAPNTDATTPDVGDGDDPIEPAEPAEDDQMAPEGTYITFFIGDNEGIMSDYGQKILMKQAIFVPKHARAVGPTMGETAEAHTVRVEIKDNKMTLWGEVDLTQLPKYYPVQKAPNSASYQADYQLNGNRWIPADGLKDYTQLPQNAQLYIRSYSKLSGRTVENDTFCPIKPEANYKVRFRVEAFHEIETYFTVAQIPEPLKGNLVSSEFRSTDKFVFRAFQDPVNSGTMKYTLNGKPLKVQEMPENYLTDPNVPMDTPAPAGN